MAGSDHPDADRRSGGGASWKEEFAGKEEGGVGGEIDGHHLGRVQSSRSAGPTPTTTTKKEGSFDAIELAERQDSEGDGHGRGGGSAVGGGGHQWPKIGADALIHESRHATGGPDGSTVIYKVYKRRWFGVATLTLLNIMVSWDWLTFSPVPTDAAAYFDTTESAINWLSIAFLFAFTVISPAVIYVLHWGPKPSIMTASVLVLIGNWVRYGGVRASDSGNFGVVMFGQILIGLAQPFVLAAPTRYSDLWFTNRGRVAATALMSLANPFGAALGQLIIPFWVGTPDDVPSMVLYVSIISTVCALPGFFIPAAPPTPSAPSSETPKASLKDSVRVLAGSPEFWMIFIAFSVYVGFFNSISSLLNQIMVPYGYSDDEAGIAGAVLIVVGLVASAISSPIIDRTKGFVASVKVLVPVVALSYVVFIWMPQTHDAGGIAGPYVVLAVLGASSFSLVPVAVELLVEFTHPVSPEVTSTLAWTGGQVLGAVFIIVSDALKESDPSASPPLNMSRALIFQAVIAVAAALPPLCLGLFGRGHHIGLRRVASDRVAMEAQVQMTA